MPRKRPRPDFEQVREALREHDERTQQPDPPPPPEDDERDEDDKDDSRSG
jgi:hypothetical protein